MAIKLEFHAIKGMLRDLTRSKFSPEFAFDAYNIRLTAREGNTLLSVTNEKGTKECILKNLAGETTIKGDYVGHCVLNNYLVLFTYNNVGGANKIYRLEHKDDYFEVVELYSGWLNISTDHPIETLGVYETDEVLKVYWTDNYNPIRYINIAKVYQYDTNFDLVKPVSVATLEVWKKLGSGSFSSGVVQYALTYYNLYGSETNIFAISDLNYCAFENRGASPEETVNCSFELYIPTENSIRTEYDYIRIYSIHRTSLDAVPTVKVVADIRTSNLTKPTESLYSLYTDAGTTGSIVDSTILQYIGGLDLIAKTLTTKDNTLFAGGITLTKHIIPESVRTALKGLRVNFKLENYGNPAGDLESSYPYTNLLELTSRLIKGFKARERYRFGILALNGDGEWSEVIYIGDYECNILPEIDGVGLLKIKVPIAYLLIPEDVRRTLVTNNYIGIRGVCVYPNFNDRSVICQGVLCPTVFNLQDRCDDSPYALSSWFTRPAPCDNSWESEYVSENQLATSNVDSPVHNVTDGEVLYFKHLEPISGYKAEAKTSSGTVIYRKNYNITRGEVLTSDYFSTVVGKDNLDYISTYRGSFGVDTGIVTMYSPDIEFDNSVGYLKDADLRFRIVGAVMMANTLSDISITTTTTGYYNDVGFIGNPIKNRTTYYSMKNKNRSGRCMATAPFWSALPKTDGDKDIKTQLLWAVYPWHRSGSLIGSGVPEEGEKRLWELKRKIMSNLWISSHTKYFNSYYEPHSGISPVNTWHSGDGLIKIKAINNPNRGFYTYYGDVDKVISYNSANNEKVSADDSSRKANGYDIFLAPVDNTSGDSQSKVFNDFNNRAKKALDKLAFERKGLSRYNIYLKTKDAVGVEPVSMKYKSGPHAVFAFNYITKTLLGLEVNVDIPMLYTLPNNGYNINDKSSVMRVAPWDSLITSYIQDTLTFDNPNNLAFLWLGELYRETVNNRFGGNSEEAILNNTWEVAGETVSLTLGDKDYILINFSGDTYVQRYDALRTYEYTSEDTNSIVDILSFICETRINIDGRYDRNRGNISNLTITPLNFNLLNPIYSQRDNYFNYHTLDYKRFSNNYFPNTIVWSKEKFNAEEIDSWSNLNMLSSLDLDGNKGLIESLNTFNNEIYCFQKKGLSNILFNSRVQIPVSDGVPIEMTNGLKVSGKRYISNTIGCSNKWSIAETPAGLYFIDNETNSLYLFNGLIQSLSDKLGFRLWIGENNSHEQWDPINYKNFRTYYDKNNDDIYFINDKTCLCYSELLNLFTSFMSYEKVPAMFNINSEFYSFNKGKLWHNFEGDYNMFYGEFKPYSITVVANSDEPYDKIFNTVEFRSDSWNGDVLINHATFDTLEVWNEYLYGKSTLATVLGHPSALKKKFRIWRANVPRDTSNHRDRIRNTWAYVKLSMNTPNTWRTEFHDMNIHYFI